MKEEEFILHVSAFIQRPKSPLRTVLHGELMLCTARYSVIKWLAITKLSSLRYLQ